MEHPKGYVRRIVTGHDDQGNSIVTEDGPAPSVHTNPKRVGYYLTNLWLTHEMPVKVDNGTDPTLAPLQLEPPKNGSVVLTRSPVDNNFIVYEDPCEALNISDDKWNQIVQ